MTNYCGETKRFIPKDNPFKEVDRWSDKDYPRNTYKKPNEKKNKPKL